MAFAEFGKKLGDLAHGTVEKSKDFAEITKANLTISSEEEKIRTCQLKVGEYVLKNNLLREDAQLKELYAIVDAAKICIAEKEEKILKIKQADICKTCGAVMPKNVKFCSECGAQRQEASIETSTEMANSKICPKCGEIIDIDSLFCGECGAKIEEINQVETQVKTTQVEETNLAETDVKATETEVKDEDVTEI